MIKSNFSFFYHHYVVPSETFCRLKWHNLVNNSVLGLAITNKIIFYISHLLLLANYLYVLYSSYKMYFSYQILIMLILYRAQFHKHIKFKILSIRRHIVYWHQLRQIHYILYTLTTFSFAIAHYEFVFASSKATLKKW